MFDNNSDMLLLSEVAKPAVDDLEAYLAELNELDVHLKNKIAPVRQKMLDEGNIKRIEIPETSNELQAVDASYVVMPQKGVAITTAMAVRVGDIDKPKVEYERKVGQNDETFRQMALLLRMMLEFRLLQSSTDMTIVDSSFWSLLMDSNKVVTAYANMDKQDSKKFESAIKECFWKDGSFVSVLRNKNLIAMSKTATSTAFSREMLIEPPISDRTLLTGVLEVGEFTRPRSLKDGTTGHFGVEDREIADRQEIQDIYKGDEILVTFYKPHPFQRAYRIEYHKGVAFIDMLARIKTETRFLGILEPISQFLADKICKQISETSPLYINSAIFRFPDLIGGYRTGGIAHE